MRGAPLPEPLLPPVLPPKLPLLLPLLLVAPLPLDDPFEPPLLLPGAYSQPVFAVPPHAAAVAPTKAKIQILMAPSTTLFAR
jgi:hypothetical protein